MGTEDVSHEVIKVPKWRINTFVPFLEQKGEDLKLPDTGEFNGRLEGIQVLSEGLLRQSGGNPRFALRNAFQRLYEKYGTIGDLGKDIREFAEIVEGIDPERNLEKRLVIRFDE